MELHAFTRTISDLFSVKRKYVVPRFQREYSWTREQVNELWDDITRKISIDGAEFKSEEYFIGALVLIGNDNSQALKIVDGQQRLTTITILLSVLCQRFIDIGKREIADAIYETYITGKDDDGLRFFKLENESPKPFFQTAIQHVEKEKREPLTQEERVLLSAYSDLYNFTSIDSLNKTFKLKLNDERYELLLKAIRTQVLIYLKVIFITVNDEDEAYTIFETLNARGMNLSFVDLIKNTIFKDLANIHPDDKARTLWREIRNTLLSREANINIETFIRHWWLSNYTYVSAEKIYSSFKKLWNDGEIESKKFIESLAHDANLYVILAAPLREEFKRQEDLPIFEALDAYRTFSITQNRPFLLSLFKAKQNKLLKHADFINTLKFLESFHFKFNAVCSLRPSGIEASYSKAARELNTATDPASVIAVLTDLKQRLTDRIPDQAIFLEKFKELRFFNGYTKDKKLIQYIFNRIEVFKLKNNEFRPENITLEHILSQDGNDPQLIGRIGNLLPLCGDLNSRAGNKDIDKKLNFYVQSNFATTNEFVQQYAGQWGENEIDQRTNDLALLAYSTVWKT